MHSESPHGHLPQTCHWMDVTLYLDFSGSCNVDKSPLQGCCAVLQTTVHRPLVTAGLILQVTWALPDRTDERGLPEPQTSSTSTSTSTSTSPSPLSSFASLALSPDPPSVHLFMARAIEEVQRWLDGHDCRGLLGLWLHVWNPRAMPKMLSRHTPWHFAQFTHHLLEVLPVPRDVVSDPALELAIGGAGQQTRCPMPPRLPPRSPAQAHAQHRPAMRCHASARARPQSKAGQAGEHTQPASDH